MWDRYLNGLVAIPNTLSKGTGGVLDLLASKNAIIAYVVAMLVVLTALIIVVMFNDMPATVS